MRHVEKTGTTFLFMNVKRLKCTFSVVSFLYKTIYEIKDLGWTNLSIFCVGRITGQRGNFFIVLTEKFIFFVQRDQ